jgi:hypothetical protein
VTRRLLICVCSREGGTVRLRLERGSRVRRLDARAVARHLETLVERRGLSDAVQVRDACAGGCGMRGPNVTVIVYPPTRPGEKPDHVSIGRRTYVGSLDGLDCLARVIDENLRPKT